MAKITQSDVSDQDVYGLMTASAKKLTDQIIALNEAINNETKDQKKLGAELDKLSQKGIDNVIKKKKELETLTKRAEKNDKIAIQNAKLKEKTLKQETAAQKIATIEKNKAVKASIKKRKSTIAEIDTTKSLNTQLRNARRRYGRLTLALGKNNVKTRQAAQGLRKLEIRQRKLNLTVRGGTKNMKLFGLSLGKVRGSALKMGASLGLAFGAFAAIRGAFGVLTEFDEKLADIQKTTGLTKEGAKEVSLAMLKIDTKTAVSELQELISAGGRLGIEGTKNLVDFATSADKVFVALGDDLEGSAEEIATKLGKISSLFGLDVEFGIGGGIERVGSIINELAATSKAAAQPLLDFTARVAGFSDVLKIEEVAAFGTIFDEGGVSMEVAASTMNKVLPNMVNDITHLAKVTGLSKKEFKELLKSNPAQALIEVAKAAKGTEGGLEELVKNQKLFGDVGVRALPVLNALTNGTEDYAKFLKTAEDQLEKNNSVTDEFNTKNNTLSAIIEKAKKKLQEQVIAFNENTNATEGLKNAIIFLVENMETIITVLVKVIKFYALYRAALIALKLSNHIKEIRAQSKALKTAGVETKKLSEKSVKLKGALKAIGWAAAIALVMEYVSAVKDAFDGTTRLKDKLDEINKAIGRHEAETNKRVEKRTANLKKELAALEESGLKGKELEDAKTAASKATTESIQRDIDVQMRNAKRSSDAVVKAGKRLREFDGIAIKSAELARDNGVANAAQLELLSKTVDPVAKLTAEYKGYQASLTILVGELEGVNEITADIIESTTSSTSTTKTQTAAVEDQTKAYKELTDILGILNEGQSLEDIESEEIAQENEVIQSLLNERLTFINDQERLRNITAEQAAEQRKIAQIEALLEQRKILELYGRDVIDIDLQISQARLQLVGKVQDETITANEEVAESYKELFDEIERLGEKALDSAIDQSKKRQDLLDDEINKSQELEDRLRDAAQNGNAIASESLAAQSDITEQKQREKIKEAKKEANLEELKALWNTLNSFLDQGDNPITAGGKALSIVGSFKKIFGSITGFIKGTKGRLKGEHKANIGGSGVDKHLVRLDGDEGVATGQHMDSAAAVGLTTMDSIFNSAIMNQQLIGVPMANHIDDRIVSGGSSAVESKLDTLIDITKNNKPSKLSPVLKQGMLDAIVDIENRNGKVIRTWTHRR